MRAGKTLDEMRKRKMMRRRKVVVKELGFSLSQYGFFINKP
jgi:hypothetical protein